MLEKPIKKPPQASAPRSLAEVRNITDKADKNKPERRQAGKAKRKKKTKAEQHRRRQANKSAEEGEERNQKGKTKNPIHA